MAEQTFEVSGMSCAACQAHVEKAVQALNGTDEVSVNLLSSSMRVNFDASKISTEDICLAVEHAGYGAMPLLEASQGAENSNANAATLSTTTNSSASRPLNSPTQKLEAQAHAMQKRLAVSLVFLLPLFYLGMSHMLGWPLPKALSGEANALSLALAELLLLLPILYVNDAYFINGFKSLARKAPTMEALIALGATASITWSIYTLFRMSSALAAGDIHATHALAMDGLYFESAGTILSLVTVGKYLETRSKAKTGSALEALMDLTPKTATVLSEDGSETVVPASTLREGQLIRIKPGEALPADGIVIEGSSSVDESALTGEPLPAEKAPGSTVFAATINRTGSFVFKATQTGNSTSMAQAIRLVEDANATKAPIARMADKVAAVFVPAVLCIAAVTFVAWLVLTHNMYEALTASIAVVVISCPCALGLATPVAIMVGTGKGAQLGVLFKSAEALEALQSIDTVVLDKTGTLTQGKPQVSDVVPALRKDGLAVISQKGLLKLAAALENNSEHPLAEAIMSHAKQCGIVPRVVEDFKALPGLGVTAREGTNTIAAGNAALMERLGVSIDTTQLALYAGEGKTPLFFAKNGEFVGTIAVADKLRNTSAQAVATLKHLGLDVVMLTGDNKLTAQAVAKRVGISQVIAGVLPAKKEEQVRGLQSKGRGVAMVGDGINDSPALARAQVGIAIGTGADIAKEGADVILMHADPLDIARAIELSRATMRTIKMGLFWALFYNSLGIPLAAGVFYPLLGWQLSPMFGAAAMSLSSVCVVANALRLRNFKANV